MLITLLVAWYAVLGVYILSHTGPKPKRLIK